MGTGESVSLDAAQWLSAFLDLRQHFGRGLSLVLQAVESGIWDRPPTMLPDANTWPTWGALRERVLTATTEINILGSATVRDAFVAEVAKLSPPELSKLVSTGHT